MFKRRACNVAEIKVGQQYVGHDRYGEFCLQVLSAFIDLTGKDKIVIQRLRKDKAFVRGHQYPPKLVSPRYLFGLTVKVIK